MWRKEHGFTWSSFPTVHTFNKKMRRKLKKYDNEIKIHGSWIKILTKTALQASMEATEKYEQDKCIRKFSSINVPFLGHNNGAVATGE